ncbi:MAG: hypothetical protein IIY08_09205 [Cellulosilyticum sp.]|nr:hypothetical protein [Cellulosilyticum sp.]
MFFKKSKIDRPISEMELTLENKTDISNKSSSGSSPLLERYLQKNMTDHMREMDDESLARAIKTLLYEESNKNLN